jgi:hypothetical protein
LYISYSTASRGESTFDPAVYLTPDAILVYLVDEEAVADFVESLGEVHDEHVHLKAFLEVLGEIVDKLDQLCLTGSVPLEAVL